MFKAPMIFSWLVGAWWATLVGYWCISGIGAVRGFGIKWIWWREITLRLGFFAVVVLALQIRGATSVLNASPLLGLLGLLLTASGVALAIGARVSLGSGWVASATSSELVTSGPYALVRHPLYGGLLLAMLGSALGQSVLWMLPLLVYWRGFVSSAQREEQLLIERYADRYRDYMRRTRMFVPFVI
jgi:protein-S-isoprenylcysteine O-methyltransferase Ste14